MAAGFKICTMERCSPLDERAVANLHSCGQFAATLRLSTTGINEMPTRRSSCPGAARLLDRAFQGAIVSHGDRMWHLVVAKSRSHCTRDRTCDGGIVARRIPSFWSVSRAKRECATTQMRSP